MLQGLAPEVLAAPRYSEKYLKQMCSQKQNRNTELDGSKMIMVSFLNPQQPTLVKTIMGDQYSVAIDGDDTAVSTDSKISVAFNSINKAKCQVAKLEKAGKQRNKRSSGVQLACILIRAGAPSLQRTRPR